MPPPIQSVSIAQLGSDFVYIDDSKADKYFIFKSFRNFHNIKIVYHDDYENSFCGVSVKRETCRGFWQQIDKIYLHIRLDAFLYYTTINEKITWSSRNFSTRPSLSLLAWDKGNFCDAF